ncbi:MAG: hypothetical protein OXC46_08795 [Thaumarchaeota archaeon]|nr:hypothetical protein [Nitrososphaerota archaeon]
MKKKKKQNITLVVVAAVIVGAVIWYNYSAEQTRQEGFVFGNELSQIQEEVMNLQMSFNSKITQWDEGDLEMQELLKHADSHFEDLGDIINMYDQLAPPQQFSASVELFKLSTDSQLQSDMHYIEWIRTGQESDRIRSDSLLQESFDFEMMALGEFNRAKIGYKEYDGEPEKFVAPDADITSKVNKIWQNMKEKCESESTSQEEADLCTNKASAWRAEHLP